MSHGLLALRPARLDDIGPLIQLLRRSWLGTMAPHLPPEGRERFEAGDPAAAYCQELWFEFTVADLDGLPVGMCHVQEDRVAAIHVDPDRQRQGIGRELMTWALHEIGRSHGAARLEVLAFNETARRFYEALGWREARRISGEEMACPVELVELRFELGDSAEPVKQLKGLRCFSLRDRSRISHHSAGREPSLSLSAAARQAAPVARSWPHRELPLRGTVCLVGRGLPATSETIRAR